FRPSPHVMASKTINTFGELFSQNLWKASQASFDLSTILSDYELMIFRHYKLLNGSPLPMAFFSLLTSLSHFGQNSFYTNMFHQMKPINIYSVIIGQTGPSKTTNLKPIRESCDKVVNVLSDKYKYEMEFDGEDKQIPSIISNLNGLSLRMHLSKGDQFMLSDEIDPAFSKLGVYEDDGKTEEATLLIKAFDRIIGDTRTTAQTAVDITKAKLAILGYTTGNRYPLLMKQWSCQNRLEGVHNRFCYMALPHFVLPTLLGIDNTRPIQSPSAAITVKATHSSTTVDLVKLLSPSTRTSVTKQLSDEQLDDFCDSAYAYTFSKIADHLDAIESDKTIPLHIEAFYAKTVEIYPKYCALIQLFVNITKVLQKINQQLIIFDDGDNSNKQISQEFVRAARTAITDLFFGANIKKNESGMLILYFEKNICIKAWSVYEYLFGVVLQLFDMPKPVQKPASTTLILNTSTYQSTERQQDGRKILMIPYNIFTRATLTKNGGLFHNLPSTVVDDALAVLVKDKLIFEDKWIIKVSKAYRKIPPPDDQNERDQLEKTLNVYAVQLKEYEDIYSQSSRPPTSTLSTMCCQHLLNYPIYIKEYHKYHDLPYLKEGIDELIKDGAIKEILENGKKEYKLKDISKSLNWTHKTAASSSSLLQLLPIQSQLSNVQSAIQSTHLSLQPSSLDSRDIALQTLSSSTSNVASLPTNNPSTTPITAIAVTPSNHTTGNHCNDNNIVLHSSSFVLDKQSYTNNHDTSKNACADSMDTQNVQRPDEMSHRDLGFDDDPKANSVSDITGILMDITNLITGLNDDNTSCRTMAELNRVTNNKKQAISKLLDEKLISSGLYFAHTNKATGDDQLNKTVGYMKCFAPASTGVEWMEFNDCLEANGVSSESYLKSFNFGQIIQYDQEMNLPIIPKTNAFTKTTSHGLTDDFEEILKFNSHYNQYVRYDDKAIIRLKEKVRTNLSGRVSACEPVDEFYIANASKSRKNKQGSSASQTTKVIKRKYADDQTTTDDADGTQ
ncbi:unnamed protein product, partial [Didymodactylos carnosus]